MADMTHANRARKYLENRSETPETVSVDATLAVATATRESATEIRNGVRNIESRLHDIASAMEPDAGLVRLDDARFVSLAHVVTVTDDPEANGCCRVLTDTGTALQVDQPTVDVARRLGVSA